MAPIADRYPIIKAVRDGAIAQLGERVVRNDEVGGSIPPGSTSLRRLRLLRLGMPYRSEGCRGGARGQSLHIHFPVNLGGRFSMKLATPSRKIAAAQGHRHLPVGVDGAFVQVP
jgi:hypothetical protein